MLALKLARRNSLVEQAAQRGERILESKDAFRGEVDELGCSLNSLERLRGSPSSARLPPPGMERVGDLGAQLAILKCRQASEQLLFAGRLTWMPPASRVESLSIRGIGCSRIRRVQTEFRVRIATQQVRELGLELGRLKPPLPPPPTPSSPHRAKRARKTSQDASMASANANHHHHHQRHGVDFTCLPSL